MRLNAMGLRRARKLILAVSPALFAACAGTPEIPPDTQAIRDYIEVGELPQTDQMRTGGRDEWSAQTKHFAIYRGREGPVLLEFRQTCREMFDNTTITADRRYDQYIMRTGVDTLRGCRIDKMYPLTEAQVQEIEALVKSAGAGN